MQPVLRFHFSAMDTVVTKPIQPAQLAPIHAVDAGLLQLIREADAYMMALYPAVSNHLTDPGTLLEGEGLFVGAYAEGVIVGCGAVRIRHDQEEDRPYGEIKRMFVQEQWRGHGISSAIMQALEQHLVEQGIRIARLETGIWQPEALGLYMKRGYKNCAPFGGYAEDPLSVFFEKSL
jgi:putative acetyltransferase